MSNYRRLISYIYAYEGGIKGKNIGFAKIEARNGQCKIQVNVKKVYVGNSDMGVYLLAGGDQILVGKIFIRNGAGEFRTAVSVGDVENSQWSMEQCYGLTIHSVEDSWQSYTTIWDDAVTQAAELQPGENGQPEENSQLGQLSGTGLSGQGSDAVEHAAEVELGEVTAESLEEEAMKQIPGSMIPERETERIIGGHKSSIVEEIEAEIQAQERVEEQEQSEQRVQAAMAERRVQAPMPEQPPMRPSMSKRPVQPVMTGEPMRPSMPERPMQPIMMEEPMRPSMPERQVQPIMMEEPMYPSMPERPVQPIMMKEPMRPSMPERPMQPSMPEAPICPVMTECPEQPSAPAAPPIMAEPSMIQKQPLYTEAETESGVENRAQLERLEQEELEAGQPGRLWNHFRKTYPKIQAFDYANGCEILTIKPQDIGLLPRETWTYGNNSFLLHGYYSYRYLILVKLNNPQGSPRFLLGVPGHYYSNEKYMASMFGFPNFVLSKMQPAGDVRFGYWYTDINMGNQ